MSHFKLTLFTSIVMGLALGLTGCKEAADPVNSSSANSKTNQSPNLDSGINGIALFSSGCGAVPLNPPANYCAPTAYSGSFALLTCDDLGQNCHFQQNFQSGLDGKFILLLQPGEYQIELPIPDPPLIAEFPFASPVQVQVKAYQLTDVQINVRSSIPTQ